MLATPLAVAVGWRDRSWRTRKMPAIAGAAALIALFTAKVGAPMALIDPLPLDETGRHAFPRFYC